MAIEIVGEVVISVYVAAVPQAAQPVVPLVSSHPKWVAYGPSLLAAAAITLAATAVNIFVNRILFRKIP